MALVTHHHNPAPHDGAFPSLPMPSVCWPLRTETRGRPAPTHNLTCQPFHCSFLTTQTLISPLMFTGGSGRPPPGSAGRRLLALRRPHRHRLRHGAPVGRRHRRAPGRPHRPHLPHRRPSLHARRRHPGLRRHLPHAAPVGTGRWRQHRHPGPQRAAGAAHSQGRPGRRRHGRPRRRAPLRRDASGCAGGAGERRSAQRVGGQPGRMSGGQRQCGGRAARVRAGGGTVGRRGRRGRHIHGAGGACGPGERARASARHDIAPPPPAAVSPCSATVSLRDWFKVNPRLSSGSAR